jgi:serine/threonine protein kinase
MLAYNPAERPTLAQVMSHPWYNTEVGKTADQAKAEITARLDEIKAEE